MEPVPVTIDGPAGGLEGRLHLPEDGRPIAGVVVCHPHPLMGGDMDNNVVMGVCRELVGCGMAVLRFNFRGVGASAGAHDQGRGEVEDAREALRYLASLPELDGRSIRAGRVLLRRRGGHESCVRLRHGERVVRDWQGEG